MVKGYNQLVLIKLANVLRFAYMLSDIHISLNLNL